MRKTLILLLITAAMASEDYTLEELQPGTFVEEIGDVAIIAKNVDVLVSLNFEELKDEIFNIANFKSRIKDACNKFFRSNSMPPLNNFNCDHFFKMSSHV